VQSQCIVNVAIAIVAPRALDQLHHPLIERGHRVRAVERGHGTRRIDGKMSRSD